MAGQSSKVSGVVQIDGTPVQRTVRAYSYEAVAQTVNGTDVSLSKSLGHATSDPITGEYTIDLLDGYDQRIFVVAFDDYGSDFVPDMTVAVGDRIHPTTPNEHVWECTGSGTLPSEEPVWVVDTETAQLYGTASMIARPFYRPMVHGPVTPEAVIVLEPWTPSEIETLLWVDVGDSATVTIAEGKISEIQNKSGTAVSFSQGNASYRAELLPQALNGLDVAESVGDYYVSSFPELSLADFAFVFKHASHPYMSLLGGSDTWAPFAQSNSSQSELWRGVGSPAAYVNGQLKSWGNRGQAYTDLCSGEWTILVLKGVTSSTITTLLRGGTFSYYLSGAFAEIVVSPSGGFEDHQKVEGYLAHKWGLTDKLASDHPFKSTPPRVTPG